MDVFQELQKIVAEEMDSKQQEELLDVAKKILENNRGEISDGDHTFNVLYDHRAKLFAAICREHPEIAWKSKKHYDGTMYPGYFICGLTGKGVNVQYHYALEYWDMFPDRELPHAPKWIEGADSVDTLKDLVPREAGIRAGLESHIKNINSEQDYTGAYLKKEIDKMMYNIFDYYKK